VAQVIICTRIATVVEVTRVTANVIGRPNRLICAHQAESARAVRAFRRRARPCLIVGAR